LAELPPAGGEPHPGKWIPLSGFADFFKLFEKQKNAFFMLLEELHLLSSG